MRHLPAPSVDQLAEWAEQIDIVEDRHHLVGKPGFVSATADFLKDLASTLGFASTSDAWSIWKLVSDWRAELQRRYQLDADLAHWYGINPFDITTEQRIGLLQNLPRVKAQQQLNSGNFNSTDPDACYRLTLLATGSETAARKARGHAQENRQRKAS